MAEDQISYHAENFAISIVRRIYHSHLIGSAQTMIWNWIVNERHVN